MEKTRKLCKCGNPVQNLTLRQYYKKKDGTTSVYLVSPVRCQECVNKAKRDNKRRLKELDKQFIGIP